MGSVWTDHTDLVEALTARFGLVIVEQKYHPQHFGNSLIVLRGEQVAARLIRDRGNVYLELQPTNSSDWTSVDELLEQAGLHPNPAEPLGIEVAVDIVCRNGDRVFG